MKLTRSVSTAAVLLSVFSACGQNPSVTRPDAATPAAADPNARGSASSDSLPEAQPSPQVSSLEGPQGPQGPRGRDGQDAPCGLAPYSETFEARRLSAEELAAHASVLPYRSNTEHKIKRLQLGAMTGLLGGKFAYVKNSQVVFAVDVTSLPPEEAIAAVGDISLKLNVQKLSFDGRTTTELLCFLDERLCSGELFVKEDKTWFDDINEQFFGSPSPTTLNSYFATQYLDRHVGTVDKQKVYAGQLTLSFEELLRNAPEQQSPLRVLYGVNAKDKPVAERTLYFVVADDTFVSADAKLAVSLTEDTCRTRELSQEAQQ